MSLAHPLLAPTSSLPRLRSSSPGDVSEEVIATALRNLTDLYCPLPRAAAFRKPTSLGSSSQQQDDYLTAGSITTISLLSTVSSGTSTPLPIDSGYASGEDNDDEQENEKNERALAELRADPYERQCAIRWLTSFIARAEELLLESDDDARQRLIDDASYILASFSSATDAEEDEDAGAIVREFRFQVAGTNVQQEEDEDDKSNYIEVRLTDGTPATGSDHTDVGLQSWGASIVVSDLMCACPEKFCLTAEFLGTFPTPRVIELGAGTGLVGITMAKLLPCIGIPNAEIIATDYHPAVLANLADNITANFPYAVQNPPVQACPLDWAVPCLESPPLDQPAQMLVATDVVYAPEHAVWLRDCAANLLAREGVFWLIASVRPNGRFEGVTDTVELAFSDLERCPRSKDGTRVLRILAKERLEKRKGVGRADETGYKVFKIGWEDCEKREDLS